MRTLTFSRIGGVEPETYEYPVSDRLRHLYNAIFLVSFIITGLVIVHFYPQFLVALKQIENLSARTSMHRPVLKPLP